jgi:hypothetical protein
MSAAVLTMVRNEAVFFPIWLAYYGRFFAPEDIYVLDHGSDDGSTSREGFVRIPISHPTVDWGWHRDALQAKQHTLLERYDVVLVTDVDEIVAPDPDAGDLGSYIAGFDGDFATTRGYEVIHMRDREPAFDRRRGVLEQRGWWFPNPVYSKPQLASVPMDWHGGMHSTRAGADLPDERLFLLHLHRMDFELCLERHKARTAMTWDARNLSKGFGYQNLIVEPEAFERWFYEDSTDPEVPVAPEQIPDKWRAVV